MKRSPIRISIFELFIIGTGIAAFIHSTWAVATYFGGPEPDPNTLHWWGWMLMGGLVAFAMDVGQVATSAFIRAGHNARGYKITFAVFALATYFTQFLYVIAHMPSVQLAAGVAEQYRPIAGAIRDAAIFIFPALLPVSTFLYTFSQNAQITTRAKNAPVSAKWTVQEPTAELTSPRTMIAPVVATENAPELFGAACSKCGWIMEGYASEDSAARGLRAHMQHRHKQEVSS